MLSFDQARAEAQWRWGGLLSRGFARYDQQNRSAPYQVGTRRFGSVKIRGEGSTWEYAFRDASNRANRGQPAPRLQARKS